MAKERHRSQSTSSARVPVKGVSELANLFHANDVMGRSGKAPVSDMHRSASLELQRATQPARILHGTVVYSLPYLNWYRVQLAENGGVVGCCALSHASLLSVGVKSTTVYPPGSQVVVWCPTTSPAGFILGSWPVLTEDPTAGISDWVQQAGGSGFQREKAYTAPIRLMPDTHGIFNFSANRPIDQTSLDWGLVTETGLGFHIDPFMTYLRVNELCGLFLNYWDSYMRLAAVNLDMQTPAFELVVREDEGELLHFNGGVVYPWEGIGLYTHGVPIGQTYSPEDVQLKMLRASMDAADGNDDLQPINRYQEYGGYLGQGHMRLVMVPGQQTGVRKYADDPKQSPDFGVWRESIGLDGSYSIQSARQLFIGKRVLIPVPKQMRLPEDQKTGDDKVKGNYKFSGVFGEGDEHKVGDPPLTGENKHVLQTAAILDLLAYNYNWRPLHPFHYHTEDYSVPEESDFKQGPTKVQDKLNFGELAGRMYMSYPTPKTVRVDSRYGEVDFFERESGIALLPDGSVTIFDGYGAQITLSGGHIRIDAPGDVQLTPGRNVIALGGNDIVLRARNSVDVTAGNKDLRLKAERNLQILGGNETIGGVLIESKADGMVFDFNDKTGEDVIMGGVVIKSKAGIAAWGGQIYMRTGGPGMTDGAIVLDAAKGRQNISLKSKTTSLSVDDSFSVFTGQTEDNTNVQAGFVMSKTGSIFDRHLLVGSGLIVNGSIRSSSFCIAKTGFGTVSGPPLVGEVKGGLFDAAFQKAEETLTQLKDDGKRFVEQLFTEYLYAETGPGNDEVIEKVSFSFRDDVDHVQYGTQDFELAESRWQTLVRMDMGSGGSVWTEPVVDYQGRKLLPWPGKAKWEDENTLIRVDRLTLFDAAKGHSKDRVDGVYEEPELGTLDAVTPSTGYKVIA